MVFCLVSLLHFTFGLPVLVCDLEHGELPSGLLAAMDGLPDKMTAGEARSVDAQESAAVRDRLKEGLTDKERQTTSEDRHVEKKKTSRRGGGGSAKARSRGGDP